MAQLPPERIASFGPSIRTLQFDCVSWTVAGRKTKKTQRDVKSVADLSVSPQNDA